MLHLKTFGGLSVEIDGTPGTGAAQQRKTLALLALVAAAGHRGISRDKLIASLWPETDAEHGRGLLKQACYALRRDLQAPQLFLGSIELRLNPAVISSDVGSFASALETNDPINAVSFYTAPFLDGFYLNGGGEFETWAETERARLARKCRAALEVVSAEATKRGDHRMAANWWRRLLELDPLSSHAALGVMTALDQVGERAESLRCGEAYGERVRSELGAEPPPELSEWIEQHRHGAGPSNQPSAARPAPADPFAETPDNPVKERSRRDRRVLYAVIALAILISATAIWGWLRPAPAKQVVRSTLAMDSTEAMAPGAPWSGRVAISPDGSRLAYIGGPRSQLLIRARNQLHAIGVPGTEGAHTPFFSPDGRQVGFLRERIVQIASLNGGPPITVSDSLTGLAGASWGPDNFIYTDALRDKGLVRVEAKPGAAATWFTTLATASGEVDHSWPDVLPNGKGVLFTVRFSGKNGPKGRTSSAIAVADIASGKHRVIVDDAMYARYATSGHLLYVTANKTLMVVPFDQNSMKVAGEPTALTEGMRLGLWGSADLAVSATGTLVYATGAGQGKQELVWVTRDGRAQAVDPEWPGDYLGFPVLSPDGKWLAVARVANAEPINIWIKRLDRGPSIKLTLEGNDNFGPAWTRDGKSVTFSSAPATGAIELWTKRADGGAPAVMQLHVKRNLYDGRWSPDGKWLVFQTLIGSPGSGDIFAIRPGIDTAPVPVVATAFTEISPAFSPNGRWLAYMSNETGEDEIYVMPFPNTGAGKWAISAGGGTEPLWSHRGNELFYRDASGNLVAVAINTNPRFSLGRSAALFPAAGFTSLRYTPQYAVAPDDRRFLMIRTSTPDKLIVVENWFEELRTKSRK